MICELCWVFISNETTVLISFDNVLCLALAVKHCIREVEFAAMQLVIYRNKPLHQPSMAFVVSYLRKPNFLCVIFIFAVINILNK